MKRFIVLSALCAMSMSFFAVNYCASSSWGYAGTNVTGGGNATPTLVSNESELKNALKNSNKVILITANITVSNQISCDKSNLTIMALPGKKLISTQQTQAVSGILGLKGTNIILRNIIFEGPGAFDCDGKDNLTLDGAKNVWVDHCDFQDGCDGNFDIKGLSDNITVSWCRFRYLKAPKAGGLETDDHRFSNLIGSSSTQKPEDGTYNITFAFCWWDEGCKQRMTRCRNCELHFLNCYWNSSVADYYVGPEKAKCYFEGCTFAGKANSPSKIWNDSYGSSSPSYCTFVNCTGNLPANTTPGVSAPSYPYEVVSAAMSKNYITNVSCGSGATLSVTNIGEVSSDCDSGDDPMPVDSTIVSGQYCIDMTLGEEPNSYNGGIPEGCELLSIVVSLSADESKGSKWLQGYLNMGANSDYITFDFSAYNAHITSVDFDVTIPNLTATKNTIAYHWNNESNSNYTISSAETETVSLTAPNDAKSFTIQRSAGTGTRISRVCFQIEANSEAGIERILYSTPVQKIIRKGQVIIVREDKEYTVTGQVL